jgi:LPPG:FO 2-phospho-L-lactate transferase
MSALAELGGETWFSLGDKDLALHIERTRRLSSGEPMSSIVADFAGRLGIRAAVVPMTDHPVRTRVHTPDGVLAFQDYFVRHRCTPRVTRVEFAGASAAHAHPVLLEALADPDVRAIVIAPSNPYLSIGPILALPGVRDALRRAPAPVIAVSPIVARDAVKGPTAKIMRELDVPVTSASIAQHYGDLLDGLVADEADQADLAHADVPVLLTHTLMRDLADRCRLAREVLRFADELHACVGVT